MNPQEKIKTSIMKSLLLLTALLSSCGTTLYKNGEKIASFHGDMTDMVYENDGIKWSAVTVDHSTISKNRISALTVIGGTALKLK